MSTSLVIVAIPEEIDRVWKVSSEEVPHLTLLYLGEDVEQVQNVDQIVQFIDHAVTMSEHGPFYLDVDRRGTLGDAEADVLFFNKRSWNLKWIRQFRGQLLQNQAIRTAFDSTAQHLEAPQEWLPHLTLGYPETPAKELPAGEDHPLYSVCFDRIAVWTQDFDGPEFRLEWPEREQLEGPLSVAWADQQKAALMHYGVKGMKWGQRKVGEKGSMFDPSGHDKGTDIVKGAIWPLVPPLGLFAIPAQVRLARAAGRGVKAKAVDVNEKRFQAHAHSAKNFVKIHNGAGDQFNREIQDINKRYPGDLTKNPKKQKQYDDEAVKLMQDSYRNSAKSIGNKHKTMHLDVTFHGDGQDFKIHAREGAPTPLPHRVEHAAGDEEVTLEITGKIQRDATGHITGFTIDGADDTTDTLAQTAVERGEEFIAHHGVKGMKWGVNRAKTHEALAANNRKKAVAFEKAAEKARGGTRAHVLRAKAADHHKKADAFEKSAKAIRSRKEPPKPVEPTATSKIPHGSRRKTKVKAEGGENHPAHEDALKVAQSKTKLKKSGAAALSNQELRDVANRTRLENEVKLLTSRKGAQFVRSQLRNEGQNIAREGVRTGVRKGVKKAGIAALA